MRTLIAIALVFLIMMTGGHCASAIAGDSDYDDTLSATRDSDDEDTPAVDDPSLVVNRPVNVQGLTGLVITNSAYTQRKGSVVAGLASFAENSSVPDYSIAQGIAT